MDFCNGVKNNKEKKRRLAEQQMTRKFIYKEVSVCFIIFILFLLSLINNLTASCSQVLHGTVFAKT